MKLKTVLNLALVGVLTTSFMLLTHCSQTNESELENSNPKNDSKPPAKDVTEPDTKGSNNNTDTAQPERTGPHQSCLEDKGIIVVTPKEHEKWIKGGFVQYTEIIAPNGKPIRIFAQDKVAPATMYRARNILRFFLEDVPETKYGSNKTDVANSMANNNATLMLPNGAHEEGNEPSFEAQPLFAAEMTTEGGDWYQNNDFEHRDASFEEIFHLLHDTGIGTYLKGALPEYQKQLLAEAKASIEDGRWGIKVTPDTQDWLNELAAEQSLAQEYIASVIDSYYGFWGPWTEGNGGMWGVYIAKTRAEVAEKDPAGYALVEHFLNPWLTYEARLDPNFQGTFHMSFDGKKAYTHKSQYLTWVTLTGNNAANIEGNEQNNTLRGNAGNNIIDGLGGNDTAIYCNESSKYTVTKADSAIEVDGPDGKDTLRNIETIMFSDKAIATKNL